MSNPQCEEKRCKKNSAWIIGKSEAHLCELHTRRAGSVGIELKDGRTLHPAWKQSRHMSFMAMLEPRECKEGWICEEHPDKAWPHDDCGGPGMPCPVDGMGAAR